MLQPKNFILVITFFSLLFIISLVLYKRKKIPPYKNSKLPIEIRIEDLLSQMTLDEKIAQVSGKTYMETSKNTRLGIPALKIADGPHGICKGQATCFPTGVAMVSTWKPELIEEIGVALAREAQGRGINILLGPCINIHRTPLGGRNFESFGEDPYLISEIASSYVKGVQSQKIGSSVKHYACNNQEQDRFDISVEINERTLREIYLAGFEIVVRNTDPYTVMSAYNKVNGSYCSANKHLLKNILKDEWGFEGLVVSDWGATHSTIKSANAGLDLEMPGPGEFFNENLKKALMDGEVKEETINDKVRRILRVKFKLGLFDNIRSKHKGALNTQKHKKLAYKVASESIVLLKNENNLLPLDRNKIKAIALIGPNTKVARLGGSGSSTVKPFYAISPYDGINNKYGGNLQINYAQGCLMPGDLLTVPEELLFTGDSPKTQHGLRGEYFNNIDLSGKPVLTTIDKKIDFNWNTDRPAPVVKNEYFSVRWTGRMKVKESGIYQLKVASDGGSRLYLDDKLLINNWWDHGLQARDQDIYLENNKIYSVRIEFYKKRGGAIMKFGWIPPTGNLLKDAIQAATISDVAVVFAGLSSLIEGEGLDRKDMNLPRGQDELIEAVSSANKNTIVVLTGGSPVDMKRWIDKVPALIEAWYPGQEGGSALADILFGEVNPSGKLPVSFPKELEDSASFGNYPGGNGKVFYAEGIFVGYRHFDKNNIEPLFPFGHGLSYTSFEFSNLKINPEEGSAHSLFKVSLDVKNTGDVTGKEVVQLYIHDCQSTLNRPPKELKAFKKVSLQPKETKKIEFKITSDSLSSYDPLKKKWTVEPGEFKILIGSSSGDIRVEKSFIVK
jgi:beta-glucosidase